jgi:hypothetical protein
VSAGALQISAGRLDLFSQGPSTGLATASSFSGEIGAGLGFALAGTTPGTQYPQLQVPLAAVLPSNLNITRTGGFQPQIGDSFVIITCGARSGTFTSVTGMRAGPDRVFRVVYSAHDVTLTVGEPVAPDLDGDGDVDDTDLAAFTSCQTRDQVPTSGTMLCQKADFDDDGDVDGNDFAVYQRCYGGTNVPADPACAP